jgi:hypothetical protein
MDIRTVLKAFQPARSLETCNFDQIEAPGTYVENRWGTLFRMPSDALPKRRRSNRKRVVREPWPVTRLTEDPNVPVVAARRIAAELGVWTSF